MLDHFGWKWWKNQQPDLDQVKLELVDIWHFALSELLRAEQLEDDIAAVLDNLTLAQAPQPEQFRLAIEALAESTLRTRSFELGPFAEAMCALPMSFADLYDMYIGKNVLNRFRQDHGYKEGSYRKNWQGREDNEHLVELLAGLQVAPDLLPDALYEALQQRYTETA